MQGQSTNSVSQIQLGSCFIQTSMKTCNNAIFHNNHKYKAKKLRYMPKYDTVTEEKLGYRPLFRQPLFRQSQSWPWGWFMIFGQAG